MRFAAHSDPVVMPFLAAIRAEVGNQLLMRLRRLSQDDWAGVEEIAAERERTFTLAYRLSYDAMALMAEELGAEAHTLLLTQLRDTDRLLELGSAEQMPARSELRQRLARGIVMGAFLRETRGFNTGAFRELAAPFAHCIDLSTVDAVARAAHRLDAGDFSVRGPIKWQTPTLRIERLRTA